MKWMELWHTMSRAGLHADVNAHLRRKIILSNQIGISIAVALFIGALNQLVLGYTVFAPYMVSFSILYVAVPFFNVRGYHTLSRVYLNVLPPLLITLLSGLILYRDPSFKFAMIPVILVPILLFGISEPVKMFAGIAWVVIAFLFMDVLAPLVPKLQSITIGDAEIALNAKINGLITFFMFCASFVYFQRLNQKSERELSQTLQEVQAQKEVIERQIKEEQEQAVLALAKQREVNALKSTFVAMTSHEFRNPLAAILSSQELLRDFGERLSAADSHELFVIIDSSVQRMTAMLDKILIIGRADAHLLEFRPTLLNLPDLCHRLLDETLRAPQATAAAQATLELRLELLGEDMAHIDENLLRHSLGNLLSNAVKYSPDGGCAVVHVRRLPQSLAFEVVDQGIGIPDEDLPHLFNAFRRASNVGNIQGTGLGLAIVKQAVELHGGTIEVASKFGNGSRFTIYLPQPCAVNLAQAPQSGWPENR